jgi:hypothetical protein
MKNPFARLSARRTSTGRFTAAPVRPPIETTATVLLPTANEVREWARSQGMNVGQRGRVSHTLYQQYRSAHKDEA